MENEVLTERERIGKKLAELREKNGLSTRGMAKELGIAYRTVYNIEHGKVSVGLDLITKIAGRFGARLEIIEEK